MTEITSDIGEVIQPEESALVLDKHGELRFVVPNQESEDTVQKMQLFLAGILIKAKDEDFINDIIDEFFEN